MQFSTQIHSDSSPFKPAINPSHIINMAQHDSKIKLKTIAQRLEINQSRKNPYLLKRRPSSNLLTLLLGSWSKEFRSSKRRLPFLPLSFSLSSHSLSLSFFSFLPFSPFHSSLSFLSFLSSLSVLLSTCCDLPLFIHTSNP